MITLDLENKVDVKTTAIQKNSFKGFLGEQANHAIPDINSLFNVGLEKQITTYIPSANTPSTLGHPCDRRLVWARTRGEDAQRHSVDLELIYFVGRESETMVQKLMQIDGFTILEHQRPLKDYTFNISAKIDCKITHPSLGRKPVLCEIKSMSPIQFPKYVKQEDFLNSNIFYYKNYYTQVQTCLYLISLEQQNFEDYCYVVLFNKNNGKRRSIIFERDDRYIEEHVFKKCERINNYVKSGLLPEAHYLEGVCEECPFRHVCDVGKSSGGAMVLDKSELNELLLERDRLEYSYKRYKEIDEHVKENFKNYKNETGKSLFLLDDYEVNVKTLNRKAYEVKATAYDTVAIKSLGV